MPVFAYTEYVTYLQMIKLQKARDNGEERDMETVRMREKRKSMRLLIDRKKIKEQQQLFGVLTAGT